MPDCSPKWAPNDETPADLRKVHQTLLALGTDSSESNELIAAAAGSRPAKLKEVIEQNPDQAEGYLERDY